MGPPPLRVPMAMPVLVPFAMPMAVALAQPLAMTLAVPIAMPMAVPMPRWAMPMTMPMLVVRVGRALLRLSSTDNAHPRNSRGLPTLWLRAPHNIAIATTAAHPPPPNATTKS